MVLVLQSGVTGAELDLACRSVIKDAGYGDKFIHSTGHGLGLEIHAYQELVHKINCHY